MDPFNTFPYPFCPYKLADGSRDLIEFRIDALDKTVSGTEFFHQKAHDI